MDGRPASRQRRLAVDQGTAAIERPPPRRVRHAADVPLQVGLVPGQEGMVSRSEGHGRARRLHRDRGRGFPSDRGRPRYTPDYGGQGGLSPRRLPDWPLVELGARAANASVVHRRATTAAAGDPRARSERPGRRTGASDGAAAHQWADPGCPYPTQTNRAAGEQVRWNLLPRSVRLGRLPGPADPTGRAAARNERPRGRGGSDRRRPRPLGAPTAEGRAAQITPMGSRASPGVWRILPARVRRAPGVLPDGGG